MEQSPSHALTVPSLATPDAAKRGLFDTPAIEKYWRALRAHKWIMGGIFASSLTLGIILTLITTPKYTASSRIEISRTQENVTNVQGLEDRDVGQGLEFYQTQYSLLESENLAGRVARALNLTHDETFVRAFDLEGDDDAGSDSANVGTENQRQKRVIEILQKNISISPIRGSSLVDVSFTTPDAALSARIANTWTEQFIASTLDRRFSSTAEARKYLEDQLRNLRGRVEQSEANLVNYGSNKRIIPLSTVQDANGKTQTQQTLVASDLEALNEQLSAATAARIQAESSYRAGGVSESAIENPAINALRQQRAMVEAELAKVLTQFEPSYPGARALKSQIDELSRGISREEGRSRDRVADAYREAVSRERSLQDKVHSLETRLIEQRKDAIQYAIYQREADTNRQLYDALLQRYKEIGVAGVGNNNIAVVDRANPPDKPSSPKLGINLVIFLLLGAMTAAIVLLVLEYMDQSLKDPQDVDRLLGIPLLGGIPRVRDKEPADELDDRKSASSEAYLSVKTNLSFLTEHGVPRSLMVTSTAPNEGKSVSTLAIARTLGRTGGSVVLIDADMRNPSIERLVNVRADKGLTNYLSGQDDWASLLIKLDQDGVLVLPAGPMPPNAAELLSTKRMQRLIAELSGTYDYVIVDSPPVLGIADAPLLSSAVEGVVLIIEANRHRLRAIENSLRRLRNANATILGAIVTKLDERNLAYGYGYDYGYGYGYGAEKTIG